VTDADLVPLLAALGLGGLALALAAREPVPDASAQELRAIAERYASTDAAARPRGLGIFVPPHEEGKTRG
jgi:hypothetical protein